MTTARKTAALIFGIAIAVVTVSSVSKTAMACGGCYRPPYQSLLERVESSQQVIVARTVEQTRSRWQGQVVRVIKGSDIDAGQEVVVERSKSDRATVGELQLLRRSPFDQTWTIEGSIDRELVEFLRGALATSPGSTAKSSIQQQLPSLRFFLKYLEHSNAEIADSAYIKIGGAPYGVIRKLAADLEPDRLLKWIEDQNIAQKRGALYITFLGACGGDRESTQLKQWIDEGWESQTSANLAAMLTAHAELNGEATIRFIEQSYIQDRDRTLGEIVAAVDALRSHGQADSKISRSRILASFHLFVRERPQLAELIIEDCARWEDWSIAPKLMAIYTAGKQSWNNALILKYLEACPSLSAQLFVKRISTLNSPSSPQPASTQ